jgi:hypothetical protein
VHIAKGTESVAVTRCIAPCAQKLSCQIDENDNISKLFFIKQLERKEKATTGINSVVMFLWCSMVTYNGSFLWSLHLPDNSYRTWHISCHHDPLCLFFFPFAVLFAIYLTPSKFHNYILH